MDTKNSMPVCSGCNKPADHIEEYTGAAEAEEMSVEEYVAELEGTYNPATNRFLCTSCYVAAGMPSSPSGWTV